MSTGTVISTGPDYMDVYILMCAGIVINICSSHPVVLSFHSTLQVQYTIMDNEISDLWSINNSFVFQPNNLIT